MLFLYYTVFITNKWFLVINKHFQTLLVVYFISYLYNIQVGLSIMFNICCQGPAGVLSLISDFDPWQYNDFNMYVKEIFDINYSNTLTVWLQIVYLARSIITHGLYIFYSIFHCGLYCRAVSITDNLCKY